MNSAAASLLATCCVVAGVATFSRSQPTVALPLERAELDFRFDRSNCKPSAPLIVEVADPGGPALAGLAFDLDYRITPLVPVLDMQVELRLLDGSTITSYAGLQMGATPDRSTQVGRTRLAAPTGAGFAVEVVATAHVLDATLPGGVGRIRTVERVTFGEPVQAILGRELLTADPNGGPPTRSRDFLATHRPAAATEGGAR